jgi:peptidoglycan/LPS O-acetylase OafA/YrhL
MRLRDLFLINTVVALLFALGFLLMPGVLLDLLRITNDPGTHLLGRFISAELLVGALVTYLARDSRDAIAQQAIILANLVASLVGFVASLAGILSDAMGPFGWAIVATYLLLALAFGYFQINGPRKQLFSRVRRRRI